METTIRIFEYRGRKVGGAAEGPPLSGHRRRAQSESLRVEDVTQRSRGEWKWVGLSSTCLHSTVNWSVEIINSLGDGSCSDPLVVWYRMI